MPGRASRRWILPLALVGVATLGVGGLLVNSRYLRDLHAAEDNLATGNHLVITAHGPLEYAEFGEGRAVLAVHGAGGGWDQGLLFARLLGEGFRVIAPSRFGYLGTPYPDDPSAAAQADAFACLLDHLGVGRASVVAFSAGGPSALQFALRHPERTEALVMVSAISDASLVDPRPVDPSRDPVLSILLTDFAFWGATTYFPRRALTFFGVSPEAQRFLSAEEHARALTVLRMILPMSRRRTGNFNDPAHWFERGDFDLGRISAPTLVIHATDDTFVPFAHGQHTASRIQDARFVPQDVGGHFVFVMDDVLEEITAFLSRDHGPRAPPPVAAGPATAGLVRLPP